MSTAGQSQIRTRMFARVLGPFFTIVPTTVAVRGSYMRTLFTEFQANHMWPWLFGAILLMSGMVIIAFHQYWRSPAAIWVLFVCLALAGLYLTYVGWRPEPGAPKAVASPSQDRADAAGN